MRMPYLLKCDCGEPFDADRAEPCKTCGFNYCEKCCKEEEECKYCKEKPKDIKQKARERFDTKIDLLFRECGESYEVYDTGKFIGGIVDYWFSVLDKAVAEERERIIKQLDDDVFVKTEAGTIGELAKLGIPVIETTAIKEPTLMVPLNFFQELHKRNDDIAEYLKSFKQ